MKKILRLMLLVTALVPVLYKTAKAEKRESLEVSKSAQAINFTQSIDLTPYNGVSAQAVYSDGTPSTFSSTSGSRASATITIGSNPSGNIPAQASLTINVVSTAGVTGDSVVLNGVRFLEGTEWSIGATTITSAANLAAHIDAHSDFVASSVGSTVTVKYVTYGSAGNGLPATTTDSTNLPLSAATFTNGVNKNTININGITLTAGEDFNPTSSSQTTAITISTTINANATLLTQVVASTSSNGVVTVKALYPGYSNYSLTSSTIGVLTSGGFPGGLASDVDPATDIFTRTNHGLTTGLKVLLQTTAGTAPTGLTSGVTYYAIKLNENQYALATTSTTAAAGTKIDITDITNSATVDMKPLAFSAAAGNGFYWQASNDNSNFTSLSTVSYSSVTYSAAGNSIWDFGTLGYKYLRVNFTGPTSGGIALNIRLFGKKD